MWASAAPACLLAPPPTLPSITHSHNQHAAMQPLHLPTRVLPSIHQPLHPPTRGLLPARPPCLQVKSDFMTHSMQQQLALRNLKKEALLMSKLRHPNGEPSASWATRAVPGHQGKAPGLAGAGGAPRRRRGALQAARRAAPELLLLAHRTLLMRPS